MIRNKEKVLLIGLMAQNTKEIGLITNAMDSAPIIMLMETYMSAIGKTTTNTEKAYTGSKMAMFMKVNIKMANVQAKG